MTMTKPATTQGDATEEAAFAEVVRITAGALNALPEDGRDLAIAALEGGIAKEQSAYKRRLFAAIIAELTRLQ